MSERTVREKHPVSVRAMIDLRTPFGPDASPDGSRVVFAVDEPDWEESRRLAHLWLASTASGDSRQITFSYEGEHSPMWSPDGAHIAFLSARPDMMEPPPPDEHEEMERAHRDQVWVLPAAGGEAQKLTSTKEGVRAFAWMPDSSAVLYLTPEARPQPAQHARDDARRRKFDGVVEQEERLRQQIWDVDLKEKKPRLIYTGDLGVQEMDVSPDGKRIVYNTNYTGDPNDYHRVDLFVLEIEGEAEPQKLFEREGAHWRPRWSPDGQRIAFISNADGDLPFSQECVWVVPAEGGEPRNLFADADIDAELYHWCRKTGDLLVAAAEGTNGPLVRATSGELAPVTAPGAAQCCEDFAVGADGTVVAAIESAAQPVELYAVAPDGALTALTELNREFQETVDLPQQEVVRWQSEGRTIEGVVVRPPQSEGDAPLPLLVQVHGGPHARATNALRDYYLHSVWAAEGYVVLQPNYRGSSGYGNAFAKANHGDLGGGDFRDILAGVDHLVAQGMADPKRVGIMGGSYGGYMANWAISQTGRFAACASLFGIFSLANDFSNSETPRWERVYMGGAYWENPDLYRERSPSTYADRIQTPTLVIHGEGDPNTFVSNSKELWRALKERGVPTELIRYPREGHGLREPNHRLDEMRRCLAWMDRWLTGSEGTQPFYRVGDRVQHEGWELQVTRCEELRTPSWHEDDGRVAEVAFAVSSEDEVIEPWRLHFVDVRLTAADGWPCPMLGVPVDVGGGRFLVSGGDLVIEAQPDRDTGRVGIAAAVAFLVPENGGRLELEIADFPPVMVTVAPHPEREEQGPESPGGRGARDGE